MEKTVKKRKCTGGFTLVELIVVIAILAILAGVGTVAYTGYIKAANKGVDKQLIGDLIYASTLADYANPGLFENSVGMIILSTDGNPQVMGSTDSGKFQSALEDSMGDLDALSLSYSGWGLSVDNLSARLGEITETFQNAGLYNEETGKLVPIGYADVAEEYWGYMEEVVTGALGSTDIPEENFETLMVLTSYVVADQSNASSMGTAWTNSANSDQTDMGTILGQLTQTQYSNSTVAFARLFASEGAAYARNMAFARYLEKNASYDGVEEDIAALKDVMNAKNLTTLSTDESYRNALSTYLNTPVSGTHSQAYVDGAAFYAFMDSLNNQYGGDNISFPENTSEVPTIDNMPDNFWEDGASYVKWAAGLGTGQDSVKDMQAALMNASGNAVIIYADKTSGTLQFTVSPADANPQDGEEDKVEVEVETPTEAITVTITEDSITVNPTEIKTTKGDRLNYTRSAPAGWTFGTCTVTNSNEDVFSVTFTKTRGVLLAVEQLVSTTNTEYSPIGTATLTVTMTNNTTGAEKTLTTTISLKALN